MDMQKQALELRLRQAVDAGELGLWDLRPDLETVHYSPQWKRRLGFPEPHRADSTHFWRCRVHPDDLPGMLAAMRAHTRGGQPSYEAGFRLRSNGSGYRAVHSRGRVIERDAGGRPVRMVGTMMDLTGRPFTPQGGLPDGPRGPMAGLALALPFHELLSTEPGPERHPLLAAMEDLLEVSLAQLHLIPPTADRQCAGSA